MTDSRAGGAEAAAPGVRPRDAGGTLSRGTGREFTKLWTASTFSAVGDGMSLTAAPLLATTLTDDPRAIAAVTMALTVPYAVFGIPAGVLADRVDLRRAMAGIDFFRTALILTLSLSVALGMDGLPPLYGCFFLIGTCETFFRNASQILVPSFVPPRLLIVANGRLLGAQTAGNQFVGPLVGAALFALAPAVPFAADSATFLVSAVLLTRLRAAGAAPGPRAPASRTGLLTDMAAGVRWLLHHRLLRNLSLTAGAINLVYTGTLAVLVVHARTVLGLHALGYGMLLACQAAGAVLAAQTTPKAVRRVGGAWTLVCVALGMAAADVAVWLAGSAWVVGAALAVGACAATAWDVVVVVQRQTLIPEQLQGRVNSLYRLVAWGAMPIGAGLAGLIAHSSGTPAVYALGALVLTLVAARLVLGARRQWFSDAGPPQARRQPPTDPRRSPTVSLSPQASSIPRSELGAEYLKHLARLGTDHAELTTAVVADELASVAYRGRFLPSPVFLSAAERRSLAADLLTVHTLLTELPGRLFGGDTGALAKDVGMTGTQASVVRRAAQAGPPLLPLARSDLYRGADGFKLLELNITSALGGFENSRICRAMLTHPALSEFVGEHRLAFADTLRGIVDTMYAECAANIEDGRRPVVALTDWPESFKTYEPRLKVMAAMFDTMGIDAVPCHVGQVRENGGRLEVHGRVIDVVYRFFLVEEIHSPADGELVEPILRAFEAGAVGMFSRLDAELYGNKGALAMLSDDANRSVFSARERACIDRFLPWTRHVRAAATDPDGQEIDLMRHAVAEQHDLILKPTLLHGGTGIVPGWTVGPQEWQARVAEAMDGPYVVQRRIRPVPETFPAAGGGSQELFLNWGVFLTDPDVTGEGGYNGCLVRGSSDPQVGIVSMSGGAQVACAFHETQGSA